MVNGVHRNTSNLRTLTPPTIGTCFANHGQFMVGISNFTDRSHTLFSDTPYFSGRKTHRYERSLLSYDLNRSTCRPRELATLPRLELNVVNRSTKRHEFKRHRRANKYIRRWSCHNLIAGLEPLGVQDVALVSVSVMYQCDIRGTVGIVFDVSHHTRHIQLVSLEVNSAVFALVPTAPTADGDMAMVIATGTGV
tara:strand:- start:133 stop:714 length:582 start_codon:yes stop_codon:yes gene_type:complete